jgi:hypothetical protein
MQLCSDFAPKFFRAISGIYSASKAFLRLNGAFATGARVAQPLPCNSEFVVS